MHQQHAILTSTGLHAACEWLLGTVRLKSRLFSSGSHVVSADALSAGLIAAMTLIWLLNVLDLGLFRPVSYNLWRLLGNQPRLPLNYSDSLHQELFAFNRWWLVVILSFGLTAVSAATLANSHADVRKLRRLTLGGAMLAFLVAGELYFIPATTLGAYDWFGRLLFAMLSVGMVVFVALPVVRWAMSLVAEQA